MDRVPSSPPHSSYFCMIFILGDGDMHVAQGPLSCLCLSLSTLITMGHCYPGAHLGYQKVACMYVHNPTKVAYRLTVQSRRVLKDK